MKVAISGSRNISPADEIVTETDHILLRAALELDAYPHTLPRCEYCRYPDAAPFRWDHAPDVVTWLCEWCFWMEFEALQVENRA